MNRFETITITITATIAAILVLRRLAALNERSTTLSSRRRAAILQLLKWACLAVGTVAATVQGLKALDVSSATLAIVAAAGASGFAFALREPLTDYFASSALVIERAAAIGDEIELNGEIRGKLVRFGLRSVAVETWGGDTVYQTASTIRTFRNISAGASRAVVDIDIPAGIRTGRATAVLSAALAGARDETWRTTPEVLGVVAQHLDRYVMRISCMVEPGQHNTTEYRLKAAAVDAVAEMLEQNDKGSTTLEMIKLVERQPAP
jgi:small-conductance mechanosensitive channel